MQNTITPQSGRRPDIVTTVRDYSVNLFFSQTDNPDALSLSQNMLTISYAKKLFSEKKSATPVDKTGDKDG